MSKPILKNKLTELFPDLTNGPPQFNMPTSTTGNVTDAQGAPALTKAQIHFQNKLKSPTSSNESDAQASSNNQGEPSKAASFMAVQIVKSSPYFLAKFPITKASYKSPKTLESGVFVDSSEHYFAYTIKDEKVRVIHKTSVKSVLLSTSGRVVDVKFSPMLPSVIITTTVDQVVVWDLRFDEDSNAVQFRETAKLSLSEAKSVTWHPVNRHIFAVAHGKNVSCVQLSKELWSAAEKAQGGSIPIRNIEMASLTTNGGNVRMVSFDPSGASMAVACENGAVLIADSQALIDEMQYSVVLQVISAIQAHKTAVCFVALLDQNQMVTAAVEQENKLIVSAWLKRNEWALNHGVIFPSPGPIAMDSSGSFLIVGNWLENAIFVSKFKDGTFSSPSQFQQECPAFSFATRTGGDRKIALLIQEEKGICLFTIDPSDTLPPLCAQPLQEIVQDIDDKEQNLLKRNSSSKLVTPAFLLKSQTSSSSLQSFSSSNSSQPAQVSPDAPLAPTAVEAASHTVAKQQSNTKTDKVASPDDQQSNGLEDLLSKHMDALYERLSKDAEARARKDTERQKNLLTVLHKSMSEIADSIEESVREVLEDKEVLATIGKAVSQSVGTDELANALSQKITSQVKKPITDAFTTTFRSNIIPAFEAGCGNIIEQMQQCLPKSDYQLVQAVSVNEASEGVSAHVVQGQRELPQPMISGKLSEIQALLGNYRYNDAILMALSEIDLNLVLATLKLLDYKVIFPDAGPCLLSNVALITLIQQLSTDLRSEQMLKLKWIRGATIALNPSDPVFAPHSFQEIINQAVQNMLNSEKYFEKGSPLGSEFIMCVNVVKSKSGYQN